MTHNAPFAHIAYQLPDGTTGVLDNHDADAIHDVPDAVDAENLATGAVVNGKIAAGAVTETELAQSVINSIAACPFPIGALYMSFLSTSPSDIWPGTTWVQQTGRFVRMANDTSTGGADTVTLTKEQMPSHNHDTWLQLSGSESAGFGLVKPGQGFNDRAIVNQGLGKCMTSSAGGGKPHNNMPAYQDVYAWKRTA